MKRKKTKVIDNVIFFDCREDRFSYILEFGKDKDGEYGILTCPYPRMVTLGEIEVCHRVDKISGRLLNFIEREFFDKQVVTIPVEGFRELGIDDFVLQIMPDEIYEQLLDGTYNPAKPARKKARKKPPKSAENEAVTLYAPQNTESLKNVLGEIFKDKD